MRVASKTMLKLAPLLACTTSIWGEAISPLDVGCYKIMDLASIAVRADNSPKTENVKLQESYSATSEKTAKQSDEKVLRRQQMNALRQKQEEAWAREEQTVQPNSLQYFHFKASVARQRAQWSLTDGKFKECDQFKREAENFEKEEKKAQEFIRLQKVKEERQMLENEWAREEQLYLPNSVEYFRFKASIARKKAKWCFDDKKFSDQRMFTEEAKRLEKKVADLEQQQREKEARRRQAAEWQREERRYEQGSSEHYRFKARVCRTAAEWFAKDGDLINSLGQTILAQNFERMAKELEEARHRSQNGSGRRPEARGSNRTYSEARPEYRERREYRAQQPDDPNLEDVAKNAQILGFKATSLDQLSWAEVDKAYKKLALIYHPDKNHGDEKAAEAKFQVVQAVHEYFKGLHEDGRLKD